jgi:membrane protein implicated in regulation of membrane protease activity
VIGGIAALYAAMRLAAVAAHSTGVRLRFLHLPEAPGGRVALGSVLFALVVALLAVLMRRGEQRIVIEVSERGAVTLGTAALERVVGDAVGAHPDIVRRRVQVESRGDGLAARVWAAARPQADAAALRAEIEETARAALGQATGLPVTAARVKLKILRAKDLRRYL